MMGKLEEAQQAPFERLHAALGPAIGAVFVLAAHWARKQARA
jgi:hypothetical protein